MKSSPLQRPCPVCDTRTGRLLHRQHFVLPENHPLPRIADTVVCDACGLCFADTPADQATYDSYYSEMSKYADGATSTGAGTSGWDADRLSQTAAQIADFAPDRTTRILDIGCANGGLIAALETCGYTHVSGLDPSPACVRTVNTRRAGRAQVGSLSRLPEDIGLFDGILLSHVLEHVRDLRPALQRVRQLLHPNGWVYLETPDALRYAEFLVAPFQDFNIEHINHFSSAGLANLCRANAFTPESGGEKTIFSAKDMPYPAVYWFARRTQNSMPPLRDPHLADAIGIYTKRSQNHLDRIDAAIRTATTTHPKLVVWGTGQLTLKLLADTCLGSASIEAFVDGNPIHQGRTLHGVPVLSGAALTSGDTPILVASLINAASIQESIRSLGLTNPILTLPHAQPPPKSARQERKCAGWPGGDWKTVLDGASSKKNVPFGKPGLRCRASCVAASTMPANPGKT